METQIHIALDIARVASDTKAGDVAVLHVAPLVYWTSYMVLATVYSRPQLQAVLAKAEAIVWLIEGARRVTGQIVYVDGGMHIAPPR